LGGSYNGGGNAFYLRTRDGDAATLNPWREIITSGNIGIQSVNYATNAGNLGGLSSSRYPKQDYYSDSSYNWNTIEAADTTAAIVLRIESAVQNPPANDVYNWSLWQQGTRTRGSQIAVSAYGAERIYFRGSNFDTGSYHDWNEIIHSGNIASQSVGYASSAGNADTVDGYHETAFVRLAANSSSPTNGTFAIGSASSRNFIQSHSGQPLDINPLGNSVTVGSSLSVSAQVITSSKFRYSSSVADDSGFGLYFDGGESTGYAIYREAGAWNFPYPDLRIAFHTGIKLGANATYEGIRFYTDTDMSDQVMSVNNGSDPLGGGNVYVNRSLQAGNSLRAPIFYDSQDTGFYLDPNATSNLAVVNVSTINPTNTYVGNAIYFGGGNNYLNWTSGRIYSNVGIQSENSMRAPQLRVTNSTNNAYITGNSDWGLAIVNDNGFIQFGPANNSWSHIYSDKSFYFNQDLYVNGTRVVLNSGTWGINITGSSSQSNSLAITGYGSGNMTYYQSSGTFAGQSGWAGYFISNHGDGATYYNQTIIMPFWGAPQYSRLQGGTFVGPYTFWSTENLNDYAPNMNQYVRTSDNVTFNTTNAPTILVNNHSDNTKGYRIHNTSGSSVSAMFTNSSNQLVIAAGAVDQINLNKKVYVNGVALGVNVSPSATAGRIDASNDIVAYSSSDERLKYNITPIDNAIDKVKSLTGVEFDWKPEYKHAHGYEGHDTGIIAQQVQEVIPSAVRTNDTGFLAVRYEKLIGLLIEANKELAARVEELEKKLG
jgi:hypothetical protein